MPKNKQFDEEAVICSARDIFWAKGYNGTSMDELVQATGLSRSSIYDTFGDKHGLYLRTLEQYRQGQQEGFEGMLERIESPLRKIQGFFQYLITDILSDRSRKGCFLVNAATELKNSDRRVSKLVNSNLEKMESMFFEWVKDGQSRGEISKKHSARKLSRYLYASLNGLRLVGMQRPDREALEEVVKVALSLLKPAVNEKL